MSEQITEENLDQDITPPENKNEASSEESRFKEGQLLRFVRVRFPGHIKSYPFLIGKREMSYGQKVVAMSDRGMAVGYINSFPYDITFHKSMLPIKSISKMATDEDLEKQKEAYKKEKECEVLCKNLIEKHSLDMNLTHVEFTQFGKKVVFYFTAPARVDFRDLVRDLVGELKLRIELRQISVRDRAAAVGGIGPCGRQLCCSSFLGRYGSVNIKMAKNQNLTLTYSRLNGVCGQLKCCLQYEDDVYDNKRKNLPEEGSFIECKNGVKGRFERLHILSDQVDLLIDRGSFRRFSLGQFVKKIDDPTYRFPEYFEHITNETSKIIGLSEEEAAQVKKFEAEISDIKIKGEVRAQSIFEDLFGVETFAAPQEYEEMKRNKLNQKNEELKKESDALKRHNELVANPVYYQMQDDDGDDEEEADNSQTKHQQQNQHQHNQKPRQDRQGSQKHTHNKKRRNNSRNSKGKNSR